MKFRRTVCVAVAAAGLVPIAGYAPVAHATSVCVENTNLTFSPPLTLSNQLGTATLTYSKTCADAPGLTPGSDGGTVVFSYFGSCVAAVLTEGTESVVIGGTAYVMVSPGLRKAEVLTPDGTCATSISRAHGTGTTIFS